MPTCELCGKDTDSTKTVKIEGAKLDVCDSCSDMGEEVETNSQKRKKKSKKSTRRRSQEVLVNDYGEKLKEAREDETLSIKELSDELNEKESLIKKIENQQLKPDKSLAQKLSKRFNIELYTNPEVADYSKSKTTDRKATMEDVADIN
ncbi:MAG: multiprotein bridging factor aMBF1 [Candidatus Nanohaloarchaea archaeon]